MLCLTNLIFDLVTGVLHVCNYGILYISKIDNHSPIFSMNYIKQYTHRN